MEGNLINAVLHRGDAVGRCVSGGVHLVRQLLHQRLQTVELAVAVCSIAKMMVVNSRLG
jgi:hypothetical protein